MSTAVRGGRTGSSSGATRRTFVKRLAACARSARSWPARRRRGRAVAPVVTHGDLGTSSTPIERRGRRRDRRSLLLVRSARRSARSRRRHGRAHRERRRRTEMRLLSLFDQDFQRIRSRVPELERVAAAARRRAPATSVVDAEDLAVADPPVLQAEVLEDRPQRPSVRDDEHGPWGVALGDSASTPRSPAPRPPRSSRRRPSGRGRHPGTARRSRGR